MPGTGALLGRWLAQEIINGKKTRRLRREEAQKNKFLQAEADRQEREEYTAGTTNRYLFEKISKADLTDQQQEAMVNDLIQIKKPKDLPEVLHWGKLFEASHRDDLAILCFERVLEYYKQDENIWYSWNADIADIFTLYSKSLIRLDRYEDAEMAMKFAINFQPKNKDYKKILKSLQKMMEKEK